eukprot:gene2690-3336_t
MKWFQVPVEGSAPPVRILHTATILNKSDNINEIGRIVIYGGKTANGNNQFTDLAFMSIGSGAIDELAKPQNETSVNKLNKLLVGNKNPIQQPWTPPHQQQQQQQQNQTSFQQKAFRKTYSKLPLYTGSLLYHWENSTPEGTLPGNKLNHSLTAINYGSHKGRIILIGGIDINSIYSNNSNGNIDIYDPNSNTYTLSNDIYLLDCDSLYWLKVKTITGNPPSPRHSHYVCQIASESILLFGGIGESNKIFNDLYLLNLSSQNVLKWNQPNVTGTQPDLKNQNYRVCFCSGYLWVITTTSTSTSTSPLSNSLESIPAPSSSSSSQHVEMFRLDVGSFKWSTVQFNGHVPNFGGSKGDCSIITSYAHFLIVLVDNQLYFFDTLSFEWSELEVEGDLPIKRKFHSISVVGSLLLVLGGQSEMPLSTVMVRDVEAIDLKAFFNKKIKH